MDNKDSETIENWLIQRIAETLKLNPKQIRLDEPFSNFGLDSVAAVSLAGDLEDWLGFRLPATLIFDYPDIKSLSRYLAHQIQTVER